MTQTYENEREYDPRLAQAIESPGITGYQRLMLSLAGTQELDEPTKKGLFWQLIGWMGAEAGRRSARPWQYLSIMTLAAVFILVAVLYNLLFLLALGLI